MSTVTTEVWYSNGTQYTWPEQVAGVQPNVGICFPGGGTRALTAAMGQLRALVSINLLQHVDYISCVSGGSWAATAFTYYNSGAASDEEFLGPITDPKDITLAGLANLPTTNMGWGATLDLGDALDAQHHAGVPDDQLWGATIGHVFFSRFGLYDPKNPGYFSLDAASVAKIKAANPSLANAQFNVVRQPASYKLPYLLINATIDGPTKTAPYDPDQLVMITYSPLYSGIPFQQRMTYPMAKLRAVKGEVTALVGGGFIESFAWGCNAPAQPSTSGSVTVDAPATVFTVADASGTSSSAFAAIFEKIKALDGLLPEQNYWPPVASGAQPAAELFDFGDGGNLENYGLLPLIQRGVKKAILFINSESPLDTYYDPTQKSVKGTTIDPTLPPLFGVPVVSTFGGEHPDTNQVFPTSDYAPLVQAMQALKKAGQPIVVSRTHTILPNAFWGIPGGGTIDVLYVYLDKVDAWKAQLTDAGVLHELAQGELGEFAHFPNYKTIDENPLTPWGLTQLTAKQVNLMSDLTCWVVLQQQETFEAFVKG